MAQGPGSSQLAYAIMVQPKPIMATGEATLRKGREATAEGAAVASARRLAGGLEPGEVPLVLGVPSAPAAAASASCLGRPGKSYLCSLFSVSSSALLFDRRGKTAPPETCARIDPTQNVLLSFWGPTRCSPCSTLLPK